MFFTPHEFVSFRTEIRTRLRQNKPSEKSAALARYVGSVGHEKRKADEQSHLEFWGFSRGLIRSLAKEAYSFSSRPLDEQLEIWLDFYHFSTNHDELSVALAWMSDKRHRQLLFVRPKDLFSLQVKVDNWALSDGVADLIAAFVETKPQAGLAQLTKWNTSKNPWERRQSLVGLYYYARMRKTKVPGKTSLKLVKALLHDPHYFVQKAVGWSLREIYQVDQKAQLAFVQANVSDISGTAFFATIEKYTDRQRTQIKRLRARARK